MTDRTEEEERELAQDMSERANMLYWNSGRSVNSIAEGLGLSKGRFYDLILPLESGRRCSNCQSEVVFANRTAHDHDDAFCPVCDADGLPAQSVRGTARRFADMARSSSAGADASSSSSSDDSGPSEIPGDAELSPLSSETRRVLAGLLVGTVAGILLGRFLRR